MPQHNLEAMKNIADGVAVVGTVGALMQWLPAAASVFTILWLGIRIWETETIRKLTGREND
jgi:hypothetical protein